MIKLNTEQRTVRECEAEIEHANDAGEIIKATIRVRYFTPRVEHTKSIYEEMKEILAAGLPYWKSHQLVRVVAGLPDLETGSGKFEPVPLKPATEDGKEWKAYTAAYQKALAWLDSIDLPILEAIHKAVEADIDPKSQGGK